MGWIRWAEMRLLEAADAGGWTLRKRHVSRPKCKSGTRYLWLTPPTRPRLMVRIADHPASPPFVHKPGSPPQSFDVHRVRTLQHVVGILTRGRMSLQLGELSPAGGGEPCRAAARS